MDTLHEAQPTYIFGVPRVWEKMQEKIMKTVRESSTIRQKIFYWAQQTGLEAGYEAMNKRFDFLFLKYCKCKKPLVNFNTITLLYSYYSTYFYECTIGQINFKRSSQVRSTIFLFNPSIVLYFKGTVHIKYRETITGGCAFKIANKLVFSKLRERLGFTHTRTICTAAAPIMKETLDFFLSLGIPILEIFGMTETTGAHCEHILYFTVTLVLCTRGNSTSSGVK